MTLRHTRGPPGQPWAGQHRVLHLNKPRYEAPKPLAKIASGGELSRITLAIKNAMADKDAVPTVIYDEIDSGVSGKAAGRIGEVLRQSAQGHQILCITHTAQIAALADCHLLIQKNVSNERTYTEIHPLDENGRVEALARLHLRLPCHRTFPRQCTGNAAGAQAQRLIHRNAFMQKKTALDKAAVL